MARPPAVGAATLRLLRAGTATNASYYTFTLAESADVTITAESGVDTYLYLREGDGRDGTVLHENDDHRHL